MPERRQNTQSASQRDEGPAHNNGPLLPCADQLYIHKDLPSKPTMFLRSALASGICQKASVKSSSRHCTVCPSSFVDKSSRMSLIASVSQRVLADASSWFVAKTRFSPGPG